MTICFRQLIRRPVPARLSTSLLHTSLTSAQQMTPDWRFGHFQEGDGRSNNWSPSRNSTQPITTLWSVLSSHLLSPPTPQRDGGHLKRTTQAEALVCTPTMRRCRAMSQTCVGRVHHARKKADAMHQIFLSCSRRNTLH